MPVAEAAPIMVVAGEASGDLHGATLCRALRTLAPARRLIGMGGDRMAAAGLERLADVTAAAAIGGTEALGPIPTLLAAWRRAKAALTGPAARSWRRRPRHRCAAGEPRSGDRGHAARAAPGGRADRRRASRRSLRAGRGASCSEWRQHG